MTADDQTRARKEAARDDDQSRARKEAARDDDQSPERKRGVASSKRRIEHTDDPSLTLRALIIAGGAGAHWRLVRQCILPQ